MLKGGGRMTGVEMIKLLKQNGFTVRKIKGSHYFMKKNEINIIVPHHHTELGKGIASGILKEAGLK